MSTDHSTEIWRDVPGYEGLYQVSSHGRVKSLARMKKISGGGLQPIGNKILSPGRIKRKNQEDVSLFVNLWKDNKSSMFQIHRLVLLAFVGPCPKGMVCRHFPDRNPENNRLSNLRWGTMMENMADKRIHGTLPQGESSHLAKLTEKDVIAIRERMAAGACRFSLAEEFRVCEATIRDIAKRRSWDHI